MGNDGFVVSMGDPARSNTCIKYVWETLEVYPGKDFTFDDIDPEIVALHKISERFEEIRSVTRSVLASTNQVPIMRNSPLREAAFQESARRILEDEKHACYVPEIIEVDSFQEVEDESDDNPEPLYFLNEKYSTITMENVKGLSVQDIILNYPETEEYIEAIDVPKMKSELMKAVTSLHQHGIRHQDITIRNIMFDLDQGRPAVIDFGKAAYGSGDVSHEDELKNIEEVMHHLSAFVANPEEKKARLMAEFAKQAAKRGV